MSARVNGLASSWAGDDLASTRLAGTSIGVQALIETPGVQNVDEITPSNDSGP
jgi:hypothetical protein